MPAIITTPHRVAAVDFFKAGLSRVPTYVYLAHTDPWPNETLPPDIDDTTLDIEDAFKDIIGLKRIGVNDVISVIPRTNWTTGTIYDQYDDSVNLINDRNPLTDDFYKFYVITDDLSVYKCLSNNFRAKSTIKPTSTSIGSFQTSDGYIWKYMYTVSANDAFTLMTPTWIPCYTKTENDGSAQWLVQEAAVDGSIERIQLTDFGANYDPSTPPSVVITGDGTGAQALAQVHAFNGTLTDIIITEKGSGYTNVTVTISGTTGVGAKAKGIISPKGGHGSNAKLELGAIYAMVYVEIAGDEGGVLPVDVKYRVSGIIENPLLANKNGVILVVSDPSLFKVSDGTITGATSNASGTIYSIDYDSNYIYVENVTGGTFSQGEIVSSKPYNSSDVHQVISSSNLPALDTVLAPTDIKPRSGEVLYYATREPVLRNSSQREQLRYIISF